MISMGDLMGNAKLRLTLALDLGHGAYQNHYTSETYPRLEVVKEGAKGERATTYYVDGIACADLGMAVAMLIRIELGWLRVGGIKIREAKNEQRTDRRWHRRHHGRDVAGLLGRCALAVAMRLSDEMAAHWFKLPLPLRVRWWEETEYGKHEPSEELKREIEAAIVAKEKSGG